MIYYQDNDITIRNMIPADPQICVDEETAQGWHPSIEKYETRLKDQAEGKCISLVAEYKGHVAGYNNLYFEAHGGPFAGKGWPIIVDFGVFQKYQRNGIGSKLMDVTEQLAAAVSDTVCLGVGMHSGYGSAQRMYVKRGYIPDGSGVWYLDHLCDQYAPCANDDDLVLWLSKSLKYKPNN